MGEWIGDKAVAAVQALAGERMSILQELQAAHELLNQMKVPNAQQSPAGTARPLNLGERIQVLYNLKSEEAKAAAAPPPEPILEPLARRPDVEAKAKK